MLAHNVVWCIAFNNIITKAKDGMKWLNKPTDTLFCPFNIIYYITLKNCLFLTQQPKFIAVSKSAKQPLHICLNMDNNSYRNPSLHLKYVSELANCLDCKHNCWNIVERRRSEYCCSYRRLSTILWPFSHNLWWCTSFNPFNNLINHNSLLISTLAVVLSQWTAILLQCQQWTYCYRLIQKCHSK